MELDVRQSAGTAELRADILRLKAERDAIIVAHNYQRDDVQAIADVVGDSFALAKHCAQAKASTIVFLRSPFHGRKRQDPGAG